MTDPITPGLPVPAVAPPSPPTTPQPPALLPLGGPIDFPLSWLLDHSAAPIQYRATIEVAKLGASEIPNIGILPYTYAPPLALAVSQQPDGTWGGSMLDIPSGRTQIFEGVGTINAARRLLEYGFDKEAPPLMRVRRILFRLLAEDEDPAFLFELAPGKGKADPHATHIGRTTLREAAAAALAQAGYESDPRLRGAARRIVERLWAYLRSPLAQKPFIRAGNQQVLAPEAVPPSFHTLVMLSFMPLFRSEHYDVMERLFLFLSQPVPRQIPARLLGDKVVPQPHLMLGDPLPHRNAADADVPFALSWLEMAARLGYMRRHEGWAKLYDRFLDDRDSQGVWHPHKGMAMPRSTNPLVWPSYPLESHHAGEERWSDVTFRLGLIGRLSGRQINVV
ncbi:MAG: hypothetical protein ACT4PJ_03550 [Gemmatimonadaceae bacterium]